MREGGLEGAFRSFATLSEYLRMRALDGNRSVGRFFSVPRFSSSCAAAMFTHSHLPSYNGYGAFGIDHTDTEGFCEPRQQRCLGRTGWHNYEYKKDYRIQK